MILYRISHISHGHQISVHYQYNRAGEVIAEQQRILNPEGALLWQHETLQAYSEQGQANRFKPDNLPPVEWLTYGPGYIAGLKLGDTPLIEFTRDRLHR
ncbi:RHS repeat protein [Citrobacter werkmanii]|nr:RHS repeat protein [Citrobacter werkmanii]